jgi:kynurenine formamidase
LVANFPLRAVGVDLLSIENIDKARPNFPAHNVFLKSGRRFLLVEDVNLSPLHGKKLLRVYVIPLRFKDADGMPVRAFAEVEE